MADRPTRPMRGAPPAHESVRFVLFGGVRVERDGVEVEVTQPKQRLLLALLLANAGERVPLGWIVEALWADRPPAATALNQLHRHIGALRRACEPRLDRRDAGRFISGGRHGYRIDVEPDAYDVGRFRQLVGRALEAHADADALALYRHALAIAPGPPGDADMEHLPGFAAVEDARVHAILAASGHCTNAADFAAVLPALRAAAARHPFDESVHACLVEALSRTGRPSEALAVYRAVRTRLRADLGIDPGAELERAQANVLTPAPPSIATSRLRPAQLPMAPLVRVGRRHLLAELAEPKESRRLLLIVGRAGVGTSSVALQHAVDIADRYPDGQLYVDLRGNDTSAQPTEPMDALADLLIGLGVPSAAVPERLTARSALLRSVLATRRALIVLDNAVDDRQVAPLLPGHGRSDVIVTSRARLPSLTAVHDAVVVEIAPPAAGVFRSGQQPA